ncbi:MAG: hypothetical protein CL681_27015 [Blastopirellula sp.]|nr:hypothetical protein [Blastopirellula sp.]
MSETRSKSFPFVTGVCVIGWIACIVALAAIAAPGLGAKAMLGITGIVYLAIWAPFFVWSAQSRRQKCIRFVVPTASLLLALMLVELPMLAGVMDYRQVFGMQLAPWENTNNLLDPDLIHLHRPHSRWVGTRKGGDLSVWAGAPKLTEFQYDVRYDRNGFRNHSELEVADCVVIGDSFVEQAILPAEELVTHRMAKELELTVVNLGQSHFGPQQELKVLERFGIPVQPKLCVWVFFEGNDLEDVWRYQSNLQNWTHLVKNYASWKERSFTKNLLRQMSERSVALPAVNLERRGQFLNGLSEQRMWFGYAGKELTQRDAEAFGIVVSTLSDAYRICRQHGIQLVVAFAPTKYRVYASQCAFEEHSPVRDWTRNSLPDDLATAIRSISSEIGFVDLTESLQQAAMAGQLVYFPDDSHWASTGHEVAARTIVDFVQNHYGHLLE